MSRCLPCKHAGSNPEVFWLQPVMVIMASVQPEAGQVVYARSNFPYPFQFHFSREGIYISNYHIVQNQPGSDLDGLVRIWPNSSAPEASWCTRFIRPGSGRVQPAHYQFPTFRLSSVLPQTAQMILCKTSPDQDRIITSLDHIVQNQPGSSLVLADCVRLWPNGSCPEASQCARIFWFASEVNQI